VQRLFAIVATAAVAAGCLVTFQAGAASAFDPNRSACYQVYVADAGYGPRQCNGDPAGTIGPSRRVEAFSLVQSGAGDLCVSVYLRNFGSQGERCAGGGTPFEVGAPGSGLDISGMQWRTTTGRLCIRYYVIFDELSPDWYGPTCSNGGSALGSFGVRGRVIGLAMYFD
jgi:hypothetical protein